MHEMLKLSELTRSVDDSVPSAGLDEKGHEAVGMASVDSYDNIMDYRSIRPPCRVNRFTIVSYCSDMMNVRLPVQELVPC